MSSSILKIVEMPNGDIVLQHSEDDGEPLVVIQFSEESRVYLTNGTLDVARAMIMAGIQAAAQMAGQGEVTFFDEDPAEEFFEEAPRILH